MVAGYTRRNCDSAWRHTRAHAMVSRSEVPPRSRVTGSSLPPLRVCDERKGTMYCADSRTEQRLLELEEEYLKRAPKGRRIGRRQLFRSLAGNTVVTAIGLGGLLELLASREALAVGMQIEFNGVTRERMPLSE